MAIGTPVILIWEGVNLSELSRILYGAENIWLAPVHKRLNQLRLH